MYNILLTFVWLQPQYKKGNNKQERKDFSSWGEGIAAEQPWLRKPVAIRKQKMKLQSGLL